MYYINSYSREELQKLLPKAREGKGPFTSSEIEVELKRRQDLMDKKEDRQQYPHLSS